FLFHIFLQIIFSLVKPSKYLSNLFKEKERTKLVTPDKKPIQVFPLNIRKEIYPLLISFGKYKK
ncbi:hypothetical protein LCGC14_2948670, partial [marine sediment metagenome]